MDVIVERCCALDVLKDTNVACVRVPGPRRQAVHQILTFGTTTVEPLALSDLRGSLAA